MFEAKKQSVPSVPPVCAPVHQGVNNKYVPCCHKKAQLLSTCEGGFPEHRARGRGRNQTWRLLPRGTLAGSKALPLIRGIHQGTDIVEAHWGPGPQPACPAISVTKSHFKAPNKEPSAQHPFLLPDVPHRPPFPISLAVWRLSLRPIPSGQPLPAPVKAAPGSSGPPPRGWGLEARWRAADPPAAPPGGVGAGAAGSHRYAGRAPSAPAVRGGRGRACHWAPDAAPQSAGRRRPGWLSV